MYKVYNIQDNVATWVDETDDNRCVEVLLYLWRWHRNVCIMMQNAKRMFSVIRDKKDEW